MEKKGKKAPRIAREKVTAGSVSSTKTPKKKGNAGETVLLLLVFGVTFLVFLQFTGMVDLPFLRFLPFGKGKVEAQRETASEMALPSGTPEVLYPGPTLENTPPAEGEGGNGEIQEEGVQESPVAVVVSPLPEATEETVGVPRVPPEVPSPSPSPSGNLSRVARIYSAMEPKDAAKILEQWSDEEVVQVLSAMKERDAARILNAMSVEKAASVLKKMREGR
ncbi:MotE family protein [Candidatus Caldatribacterium sp. SIUC1]|uniref:MotE family protein n=1 Tax=Candidatus Caldatribacterium sp. SIUC1 TaxID=3418365 RepID=UPI003F68F826